MLRPLLPFLTRVVVPCAVLCAAACAPPRAPADDATPRVGAPDLAAGPSAARPAFAPAWGMVAPARVLVHDFDPHRSEADNGAALRAAILALRPGDRLEIGAGRYVIAARLGIRLAGTASHPIWIAARDGARVVLTRPDPAQNALNVDFGRFLALQGLEITGGDTGVKLYDCVEVWLDRCHVHHVGGVGIAANSADTARLWLTRNEVHDTAGSGEGLYLGAARGAFVTAFSVIAHNHVYRCSGMQGDGIELKQGSYGNHIVGNVVHDTNYPCILLYGTGGRQPNVVERNVCYRSNDVVLQVQGEAIVFNNALFGGTAGFTSHDHEGATRDLVFAHNTVLCPGRAVSLAAWGGRPGMAFLNNAIYSGSGDAVYFHNGSAGVLVRGNVALGTVRGTTAPFARGTGLADFVGATFDGSALDVRPSAGSPLLGAADPAFVPPDDLFGAPRTPPFDAGCRER